MSIQFQPVGFGGVSSVDRPTAKSAAPDTLVASKQPSAAPAVIKLPEDFTKPTLVGIGFGARLDLGTVVEILGEATVRNRLPKQLQGVSLPELSKQGVSVAMFLATPPDALSDPGRAAKSAGLFVSFTLPGTKTSWVTVLSPGQESFLIGRGRAFPVLGGEGLILANAYGGVANALPGGKEVEGRGNGLLAALVRVPGSKPAQRFLASTIDMLSNRIVPAGAVAAAPGSGGSSVVAGAQAKLLLSVLSGLVEKANVYAGPAWGVSATTGDIGQLKIQRGHRPPRDFDQHALEELSVLMLQGGGYNPPDGGLNLGLSKTAAMLARWHLERATSPFQLAAVSGGQNHGMPWLDMLNVMNKTLQEHGLLERTVPTAQRQRQGASDDGYVVMHGMLNNGRDANERLGRLRDLLLRTDPAKWEAFVDRIRPAAMRYGLNFGLPELQNAGGPSSSPMSAEDRAIRDTFLRTWDKGTAQQQREIVPISPQLRP